MLIELLQSVGLQPKKTSSTRGGEYHSSCPGCGGEDRFAIWPKNDRYWCRQCKKSGDSIQFCRDFMDMSYQEACIRIGNKTPGFSYEQRPTPIFLPSQTWDEKGKKFVESCHQRLLVDKKALESMNVRGLSPETLRRYSIGINPISLFPSRGEWGLEKKIENGKEKKLWLPSGIVIPTFQGKALRKIKIRRNDWKEGDKYGKYFILQGSQDCISVFGDPSIEIVVVVEAEFDAMLVVQEASSICSCIALGGAQKRPDASLHQGLLKKKLILFALDFDEAGKKEYPHWQSTYPNLAAWPVPKGKSPAEAWKLGVDLKQWVLSGIRRLRQDKVQNIQTCPQIEQQDLSVPERSKGQFVENRAIWGARVQTNVIRRATVGLFLELN